MGGWSPAVISCFFVIGDIGVELAEVFVAEGGGFQFHEDVAF